MEYETAKALVMKNLDNGQEISSNFRMLGEIYANSHDDENLFRLISQMHHDERINFPEVLYLIGKIHDEEMLQKVCESIFQPILSQSDFSIERDLITAWKKDVVRARISDNWIKATADNFTVTLKFLDAEKEYVPEKDVSIDAETNTVSYLFKEALNEEDMIERGEQKTMIVTLHDPAETMSLFIDVTVQEVLAKS